MIEAHAPAPSGAALRRLLAAALSAVEPAPAPASARSGLREDLRFFARAYLFGLVLFMLLIG